MTSDPHFRSGYVGIVGMPNVGKSTLLNSLIESKLSIVSPRPQTTRDSLIGIINGANHQMIFVDTPGWLKPQDAFQSMMRKSIMRSVHDDADVLVWVIDPKNWNEDQKAFGAWLMRIQKPLIAVINKADLGRPVNGWGEFEDQVRSVIGTDSAIVRVAARLGQGVSDLKNRLVSMLPLNPPYFPQDQLTDRWERYFVAEVIRERMLGQFQEEVPHAAAVMVEEFIEQPNRKDVIRVIIYTETEGQLGIIVGKKGAMIKLLGQKSREEIESRLGRPVHLELKVKVKKNWRKDDAFLKSLGANHYGGYS